MVVGWGKTRCLACGAVDVVDRAAGATHDVVVVVADARLVTCHRSRWLDPAYESRGRQRAKRVVDRLVRYRGNLPTYGLEYRVSVGVRRRMHCLKYGEAWPGHAQVGPSQQLLQLVIRWHGSSLAHFPESFKKAQELFLSGCDLVSPVAIRVDGAEVAAEQIARIAVGLDPAQPVDGCGRERIGQCLAGVEEGNRLPAAHG